MFATKFRLLAVTCLVLSCLLLRQDAPSGSQQAAVPEGYDKVAQLLSVQDYLAVSPVQRRRLVNLVTRRPEDRLPVACCWTAPMPWAFVQAFNLAIQGGPQPEFILGARWLGGNVATPGGGSFQGDPITIRYSFVPDGTFIPGGVGEPASGSVLFASFNGVFSSQATWQSKIQQAFARWSALSGINYIFEPNDDGASFPGSPGQIGVRGDIRISGHHIDGASGPNTLAYNLFPSGGGDMVLDTDNSGFFGNATSNFRRLRNVVAHENGHGLGMFHVCPDNNTKLMEPSITTAFDGPQQDDILGVQRQYGDNFENNNSATQAFDLGTLQNGTHVISDASIDDNSDTDYFKFTVTSNKALDVTLSPVGTPYVVGPETPSCNTGTTFDPSNQHNLSFQVLAPNGTTQLANVNQNPAGQNETIQGLVLISGPGTYFVRILGSSTNNIQRYSVLLTIASSILPAFSIDLPNGVPAVLTPGQTFDVNISTTNIAGAPDPSTGQLFVSADGAPATASPLADLGGGNFLATLPAVSCFTQLDWYVSIAPLGGGAPVLEPAGAPTGTNRSEAQFLPLITIFSDDFELNTGWTVVDSPSLTAGTWERAVPGPALLGSPSGDADGSGQAFVTANSLLVDVDDGSTTMISPTFNITAENNVLLELAIWFDNSTGANPGTEPLFIDISSDNGATWTNLETYNQSQSQWVIRRFRLAQVPGLSFTNTMKVRIVTQDPPPASTVEAGVDAFKVLSCRIPASLDPSCAAGTVGIVLPGGPEDVFNINFSTGVPERRVDLSLLSPIVMQMSTPSLSPGPAPFAIFGFVGVPGSAQQTILPFNVGNMCFSVPPLDPTNPLIFTLTDNLFGLPGLIPSNPTPWLLVLPALGFPAQFTLQPIILEDGIQLRTGNAIILNVQ